MDQRTGVSVKQSRRQVDGTKPNGLLSVEDLEHHTPQQPNGVPKVLFSPSTQTDASSIPWAPMDVLLEASMLGASAANQVESQLPLELNSKRILKAMHLKLEALKKKAVQETRKRRESERELTQANEELRNMKSVFMKKMSLMEGQLRKHAKEYAELNASKEKLDRTRLFVQQTAARSLGSVLRTEAKRAEFFVAQDAFARWVEFVRMQHSVGLAARRFVQERQSAMLKRLLRGWKSFAVTAKRQRKAVHVLRNFQLHKAFQSWKHYVKDSDVNKVHIVRRARRKLGLRDSHIADEVVTTVVGGTGTERIAYYLQCVKQKSTTRRYVFACLRRWREYVGRKRLLARISARLVSRRDDRMTRDAWRRWAVFVAYNRAQRRKVRVMQERVSQNLLRSVLRSWHYSAQRTRRNKAVVRRCRLRHQMRLQAFVLGSWRSFVRQSLATRRAVGGTLHLSRSQSRSVVSTSVSDLGAVVAVASAGSSSSLLKGIGHTMTDSEAMLSAFQGWVRYMRLRRQKRARMASAARYSDRRLRLAAWHVWFTQFVSRSDTALRAVQPALYLFRRCFVDTVEGWVISAQMARESVVRQLERFDDDRRRSAENERALFSPLHSLLESLKTFSVDFRSLRVEVDGRSRELSMQWKHLHHLIRKHLSPLEHSLRHLAAEHDAILNYRRLGVRDKVDELSSLVVGHMEALRGFLTSTDVFDETFHRGYVHMSNLMQTDEKQFDQLSVSRQCLQDEALQIKDALEAWVLQSSADYTAAREHILGQVDVSVVSEGKALELLSSCEKEAQALQCVDDRLAVLRKKTVGASQSAEEDGDDVYQPNEPLMSGLRKMQSFLQDSMSKDRRKVDEIRAAYHKAAEDVESSWLQRVEDAKSLQVTWHEKAKEYHRLWRESESRYKRDVDKYKRLSSFYEQTFGPFKPVSCDKAAEPAVKGRSKSVSPSRSRVRPGRVVANSSYSDMYEARSAGASPAKK